MTPQKFVKQKYPNAKNMWCENGGHAIMFWENDKRITLSYGNTSAKAWSNAKINIEKSELVLKVIKQ